MNELFRFSLARAAQVTDSLSLSLERRTVFQAQLQKIITANPRAKWERLEAPSLDYLGGKLPWIQSLQASRSANSGDLIGQASNFPSQVRTTLNAAPAAQSVPGVAKLASAFKGSTKPLSDLFDDLCDLMIALIVCRASGPNRCDQLMRLQTVVNGKAVTLASPLIDFLKSGRPTLNEIGSLLRSINLIQAFMSASPPAKESEIAELLDLSLMLPSKIFERQEKPVHAVGVTDLLVVKQHVLRYELGEIARIENVLSGEERSHSQKHVLTNEQETFFQTDSETTTEQELTSHDHVSLRNEVENTINEDTNVDAGVHAQYEGGSVKVQADLTVSYERATSEARKSAEEIARDVTERAAKKVTERILQSSRRKVTETFEEEETQKFKAGTKNVSGVYQWVDKVYLAQVFNYGKRVLFDLMVPEPASSLLSANLAPLETPPTPPPVLAVIPTQIVDAPASPFHYAKLASTFGVTGLEPPPPLHDTVAQPIKFDEKDDDIKQFAQVIRLKDGYAASSARIAVRERRNDNPSGPIDVNVTLGATTKIFAWPAGSARSQGASATAVLSQEEGQIGLAIITSDVNALSVDVEITCTRTATLFAKWQLETFSKISAAARELESAHKARLASAKVMQKQEGVLSASPPEINRQTERTELKRGCIALLDDSYAHTSGLSSVHVTNPAPAAPFFDPALPGANENGAWVRWFEQAFEWERMSYVLYPYFWGRSSTWLQRLQIRVPDDPLFENFLKAGYARVVVPVRKGFEAAVNFFLLTGRPWMGGDLPSLGDRTYFPITEEIKAQTGAPGKEKPIGDPWLIRLPTRLIKLRTGNESTELPKWERQGKYPTDEPVHAWSWEIK